MVPFIDQQITFLYTRDLQRTSRFYSAVMGLKLVLQQEGCRIWQVTETAFLGFCERDNAPLDESNNVIFTFVTDDVDGWFQRLSAMGVKFTKAPAENPIYDIYNCFLRDPNGYLLEIQRFNHPFP